MAETSKIEWTDATWNPITGCTVLSRGCQDCYAMRLAGGRMKHHWSREGLTKEGPNGPVWTGEVRLNKPWLDQPERWKRPRMIFVCAHADLFHESVPDEWIDIIHGVMYRAKQHVFQVLTKRPERMRRYLETSGASDLPPLPNVWYGASMEDQETANLRLPELMATPAAVRWVSAEPLLGPIDLTRWMVASDNPSHGGEQTSRGAGLSLGSGGHSADRRTGSDLARPEAGGERHRDTFPDSRHEGGNSPLRYGPSAGVAASARTDSRKPDGQSQERGRKGQPPRESGAQHTVREHNPCSTNAQAGPCGPSERRSEPCEQADRAAGGAYPTAKGEGRAAQEDRRGLRRERPDHLENRTGSSLDWLVVGGESGPRARPMDPEWARFLRDQCQAAGVPFFMKQMAKKSPIPKDLQIRELLP